MSHKDMSRSDEAARIAIILTIFVLWKVSKGNLAIDQTELTHIWPAGPKIIFDLEEEKEVERRRRRLMECHLAVSAISPRACQTPALLTDGSANVNTEKLPV